MYSLVFFGTSDFSAKILQNVSKEFDVLAAVTKIDKEVGRNKVLSQSPVSATAKTLGIEVIKPPSLKNQEIFEQLQAWNADIFLVVAYGKIIPKNILELPKHGAINIHGSLLPKYRGASPIQAALLNGDSKTGISIMLMDEEIDHGPVLAEKELSIGKDENYEQLENRLALLAAEIINPSLKNYIGGKIKAKEQKHNQASFTKIIAKDAGLIDWQQSAHQIYNKFRAFSKWPGIFTKYNGKTLKILDCAIVEQGFSAFGEHRPESEIAVVAHYNGKIIVPCSEGAIELKMIQLEGKTPTAATDFILGNKNFIGAKLG